MKIIKEITWGIVISAIIIVIGVSIDVRILDVIGGFGLGYYLGKLSIFVEKEKKHG